MAQESDFSSAYILELSNFNHRRGMYKFSTHALAGKKTTYTLNTSKRRATPVNPKHEPEPRNVQIVDACARRHGTRLARFCLISDCCLGTSRSSHFQFQKFNSCV